MRLQSLQLASLVTASVITSSQMICPSENPAECYPQLFEATNEWQVVREGQQIPHNLHIRVNLETGLEEARFLQEVDEEPSNIVLVENDPLEADSDAVKQKIQESINIQRARPKRLQNDEVFVSNLNNLHNCLQEVLLFNGDHSISVLEEALTTISDLSHDIELGAEITHDPAVFHRMATLAESFVSSKPDLSELIYRTMGSALRNNPEAVANILEKQPKSFIDNLFDNLSMSFLPDVIHKRILGVVHALTSDRQFSYRYFNPKVGPNASGLHKLISVFPFLDSSSQVRVINILEDLGLLSETGKRDEVDESNAARVFSSYLQETLVEQRTAVEEHMQTLFMSLLELHSNSDLPVSKLFLYWISKESENRKKLVKERSADSSEDTFDGHLIRARHGIFGNQNTRKDEL